MSSAEEPLDTADWTWVLTRPCPQCGTDARQYSPADIPELLAAAVPRWQVVLRRDDVARRPTPTTWSALEYAAHIRDVCTVFGQRLQRILTEDAPEFADWDPDEAAHRGTYAELDPPVVAQELWQVANDVARAFEAVSPEQWQRKGTRSDGAVFTVEGLAQYFAHEVNHHLYDVNG